jgi:hypothetical protein
MTHPVVLKTSQLILAGDVVEQGYMQFMYASTEALPVDFLASRHDEPAQKRDWT